MDYTTAKSKVDCPHASSCSGKQPMKSVSASTRDNSLVVEVECQSYVCGDHFIFDVGEFDISDRLDTVEIGETFQTDTSDSYILSEGDVFKVTAIADNPIYTDEKPVVGVCIGVDSSPPYTCHLFDLNDFKELFCEDIISKT